MSNIKTHCCKTSSWLVPLKTQLLPRMKFIKVQWHDDVVTSDEILEENLQQGSVFITFYKSNVDTDLDLDLLKDIMDNSDFDWNEIIVNETDAICHAGEIFKRQNYKGYWIEKTACMDCIIKIAKKKKCLKIATNIISCLCLN